MDILLRASLGSLQAESPERGETDEEKMTFEDFLNSFDSEMQRLDEVDKDLPFTDD